MSGTKLANEHLVEFWEKLISYGGEQLGLRRLTLNLRRVCIVMVREASTEEGGGTIINTMYPEWILQVNEDYVEVLHRLRWLEEPRIPKKT